MIMSKRNVSFESSCKGRCSDDEKGSLPIFYINQTTKSKADHFSHHHHYHQFLTSCHFCHKHLALDKQVYMYRGEMGFCSEECRKRQMYVDEMKKIEISTKRILASFHHQHRRGGGGPPPCQTNKLLEGCFQFRRRHLFSPHTNRAIFS